MRSYPHLAERLYNKALLVTPWKAEIIERAFRARQEGQSLPIEAIPTRTEASIGGMRRTEAGYYRDANGIALIPVLGTLVQRGDSMDAMSGLVGYNRIGAQLQAALDDAQTHAIMLELDSNGGELAGVMDLAAKLATADKRKPTWSIANEAAFSACYWLAAHTGRISVPESGSVGSIGVVMMHMDQSRKDAKQGVSYTAIFAGAHKVDFSQHAPLSDSTLALAQAEVDRVYEIFVAAVADARKLDPQAVRDTQAGIFHAKAALGLGLIDAVESRDAALAALAAEAAHVRVYGVRAPRNARPSKRGVAQMSESTTNAAAAPVAEQVTQAQARGFEEGKQAGVKEERVRIAAILTHAEAEGRRPLAEHLAFRTDMPADQAAAMLATASKAAPPATNTLAAKMAAEAPNPRIGADGEPGDGDASNAAPRIASPANIYAMRRKQAGYE